MQGIYETHSLVLQEISQYNQATGSKVQLAALEDCLNLYIYLIAQTQKSTLYLETHFVETFLPKDDDNKNKSEKALRYGYFWGAMQSIKDKPIGEIIHQ